MRATRVLQRCIKAFQKRLWSRQFGKIDQKLSSLVIDEHELSKQVIMEAKKEKFCPVGESYVEDSMNDISDSDKEQVQEQEGEKYFNANDDETDDETDDNNDNISYFSNASYTIERPLQAQKRQNSTINERPTTATPATPGGSRKTLHLAHFPGKHYKRPSTAHALGRQQPVKELASEEDLQVSERVRASVCRPPLRSAFFAALARSECD